MKQFRFMTVAPDGELEKRARAEAEGQAFGEIRPFVRELVERGEVAFAEAAVPMNRYERAALLPVLEHDLFVEMMDYAMSNCEPSFYDRPPRGPEEEMIERYMPEAIRRLNALQAENERLKRELRQLRYERESDEAGR